MDRRLLVGVLVLLTITSGCLGGDRPLVPGGLTGTPNTEAGSEPTTSPTTAPATGTPVPSSSADRLADPATDRVGWEAGYWYNETLPFETGGGLNETELEALVARTMARVEVIRGIEFQKPVPVETISRETFRDRYTGSDPPARVRAYRNATYEALLLVGESTDAVGAQQRNRASGVLGFYSAGSDRITIVTASDTVRIRGSVLAHELVHAYQFRQTDAGRIGASTTDGFRAIRSVIEGDASIVERRYERRCAAEWRCLTRSTEPGNLTGIQYGLYFLTLFPYTDGAAFVEAIYERAGWEGVDRLYETPPRSAEQVIYPDRYPDATVTPVRLPDRSNRYWRPIYSGADTLGQPAIAAMFAYTTADGRTDAVIDAEPFNVTQPGGYDYNFSYADGWAGDAFRVYRNGSDALGYVWRIAWDSPAEAREFASGYRALLRYWGGTPVADRAGVWRIPEDASPFADAFYVDVSGETVTIVNAPTVEQLPAVHAGASTA